MTVPGILTGIAAIISAITGLIVAFNSNRNNMRNSYEQHYTKDTQEIPIGYEEPFDDVEKVDEKAGRSENKTTEEETQIVDFEDVSYRIRQIVADQVDISVSDVKINTPLTYNPVGIDGLDFYEIVFEIEKVFNIYLNVDNLYNKYETITVEQLSEIVNRKL